LSSDEAVDIQASVIIFSKKALEINNIVLEELLEEIVDYEGFSQAHLDELIEMRNNTGDEILKLIEREEEKWSPDKIVTTIERNETDALFRKKIPFVYQKN